MTTGMAGLALWSFLMATAHGAGLMLVPVVLHLGVAVGPGHHHATSDAVAVSLAAVGVHTAVMLAETGAVAALVYELLGLVFLPRSWITLDLVWVVGLAVAGVILLL